MLGVMQVIASKLKLRVIISSFLLLHTLIQLAITVGSIYHYTILVNYTKNTLRIYDYH